MSTEIFFEGKSLNVLNPISNDLFMVEEVGKSIKYIAKHIKNPSKQRLENLNKEIKLLRECNTSHPNILSLFFVSQNPESITMLYEYCNKGSLQLATGYSTLTIFHQICSGVSYLHSKSIIHNNLTIHNILLQEGIPKITGLEIATEEEPLVDRNDSINRNYLQFTLPE